MISIDNDTINASATPGTPIPGPSAAYSKATKFGVYLRLSGPGPVSVYLPGADTSKASPHTLTSAAPSSGFLGAFSSATLQSSPVVIVDAAGSAVDYDLVALTDEG